MRSSIAALLIGVFVMFEFTDGEQFVMNSDQIITVERHEVDGVMTTQVFGIDKTTYNIKGTMEEIQDKLNSVAPSRNRR